MFVAPADAALRIYARWNVTARGSVTHTWSLPDSTPCHANGGGTTTVSFTSSRPGKIKIADNGYGLGDFSFDGTLKLNGTITAADNRTRNPPASGDQPCDPDPTHPVPDKRWCKTVSFRDQLSVGPDANHRGRYIVDGGTFVNHLNAPDGIEDCETDGFQGFAQIYGGRDSLNQQLPIKYPSAATLKARHGTFAVVASQTKRFNATSSTTRKITLTFKRTG